MDQLGRRVDQGWGSGKGSKGRRGWEEKAKEREGREGFLIRSV